MPNHIPIIYPTALDTEAGQWEARTPDGILVAHDLIYIAGSKGVGVYDREKIQGGCTIGTVDLADQCSVWKPGSYFFQWVTSDGTPRIGPIHIEIRQPQGQDKIVFDTLIVPRISGLLMGINLTGWVYGDIPSPKDRPPIRERVLAEFQDSEYAGYFLAKKGGGCSLESAAKLPTLSPEQRDRYWAISEAAPPALQEEKRQAHRKSRTDFLNKVQRYLELYPDHAQAALLRLEIACGLFDLGRLEEALKEVEACAKLTGPFAEEAKTFLAARAAKNAPEAVAPKRAQPTATTQAKEIEIK